MNWREHIWIDAARMHGMSCMKGTRVPVHVILDNLAAGETTQTILDQYPSLRPEHIPAALAFAAELARERVVPIPDALGETHSGSEIDESVSEDERAILDARFADAAQKPEDESPRAKVLAPRT